jgi:hypothetical protein
LPGPMVSAWRGNCVSGTTLSVASWDGLGCGPNGPMVEYRLLGVTAGSMS